MTRKTSHVLTVLSYLLCVAGIVIFLILLRSQQTPVQAPQQVEQPQIEERIAPAQPPPPSVNENKNKRQPRRAKGQRPKQKAQVYEADGRDS